ncbi:hypothetical protein NX029_11780 [Cytobacillus firmus]|nr:hypothetical protein [Cytobacillus firmus]
MKVIENDTETIEIEFKKLNRIKSDLLKIAKCIDACTNKSEKEFYQNICLEYSKELKQMKESIEQTYNVELHSCNRPKQMTIKGNMLDNL